MLLLCIIYGNIIVNGKKIINLNRNLNKIVEDYIFEMKKKILLNIVILISYWFEYLIEIKVIIKYFFKIFIFISNGKLGWC